MSNLKLHNKHNPKIKISYDEYWDFFINQDFYNCHIYETNNNISTRCLSTFIDINDKLCIDNDWICSLPSYTWSNALSIGYTLYNIGYTGVDNGLITFRRDMISNEQFIKIYTESTIDIPKNDLRLKLHKVSGNTLQYDYPSSFEDGLLKLNGGFYQGFFMTDCDKYQVLPNTLENDLHFEFELKKCEFDRENKKPILNDKYPKNKGIFFYIGTRAENKWAYLYNIDKCETLSYDNYIENAHIDKKNYIISSFIEPNPDFDEFEPNIDNYTNFNYYPDDIYINNALNVDKIDNLIDYVNEPKQPPIIDESLFTPLPFNCQEGCEIFGESYLIDDQTLDDGTDYIQGDIDISDFEYKTEMGVSLTLPFQVNVITDNKFLLFNRTSTGYTVNNWNEDTKLSLTFTKKQSKYNLFIYMNRTPTGYTTENINELLDKEFEENGYDYNIYKDIYNNALGFQILDNGSIGYRYITLNCNMENNIEIIEGYSKEGIINNNEWYTINVRIKNAYGKMKLYFYVNGKLKFISRELQSLNLRKLHDLDEKQETVPYNISLGGGSQGLIDTIQPNYMLNPTRVYPIEENFAGSFIGYIKSFKIYTCPMTIEEIRYNSNNKA